VPFAVLLFADSWWLAQLSWLQGGNMHHHQPTMSTAQGISLMPGHLSLVSIEWVRVAGACRMLIKHWAAVHVCISVCDV